MNDIYSRIYRNLIDALSQGDNPHCWPDNWKMEKEPYQPLHINILERGSDFVTISLAHYYKQNGDLVPDPDMQIRLYPKHALAEALTFQNAYVYQEVYRDQDGKRLIHPETKRQLNAFLLEWTRNLKTRFSGINPEKIAPDSLP